MAQEKDAGYEPRDTSANVYRQPDEQRHGVLDADFRAGDVEDVPRGSGVARMDQTETGTSAAPID